MSNHQSCRATALIVAVATIVLMASPTIALDLYQDRRGGFTGIGMGGFAVFQGDETGGAFLGDIQLGGGITEHLTLNLDADVIYQIMGPYSNWLFTPGPEFTAFFGDSGIYVRLGLAAAFNWVRVDKNELDPDDPFQKNELLLGGAGTVGLGFEFFINSDAAINVGIEGDYVLKEHDDIVNVGFILGLRYY